MSWQRFVPDILRDLDGQRDARLDLDHGDHAASPDRGSKMVFGRAGRGIVDTDFIDHGSLKIQMDRERWAAAKLRQSM
jgi:hypothetical protein